MFDPPIKKPNTLKPLEKVANWKQAKKGFKINHHSTPNEGKTYQSSNFKIQQICQQDKVQPISAVLIRTTKDQNICKSELYNFQGNIKNLGNFTNLKRCQENCDKAKTGTKKQQLSNLEELLSEINQQSIYEDYECIQKDSSQKEQASFVNMKNKKFRYGLIIPNQRYQLQKSERVQESKLNPQQPFQQPKVVQKKFNYFALSLMGIKRKQNSSNSQLKQSLKNNKVRDQTVAYNNMTMNNQTNQSMSNRNKQSNRFSIPIIQYKRWLPKQINEQKFDKRHASMQQIKQSKRHILNPQASSLTKYPELDSDCPFQRAEQYKPQPYKLSNRNQIRPKEFKNIMNQKFQENSKILNFISQSPEEDNISIVSQSKYSPSRNRKRVLPSTSRLNSKEVMQKTINFKTTIQELRKLQHDYKLNLINQIHITIPQFFLTIQITPQIDLTNLHSLASYIFKFLGFPSKVLSFKRYQHSVAIINSVNNFVKRNNSENKLAYVYHFECEKMYLGEWNNHKTGLGLQWKPGNYIYYGQFINGKRDGLGAMKSESKDFYLGYWRKGWKIENS